jgi:hypothetical protein
MAHPMAETLRGFGFVRVPLPSNLMNVGSLYYVDAGLSDFKTTCHVGKAELGDDVIVSRSEDIEENLQRNGLFATNVTVDFGPLVKGALDANFVHKVHFSLTDVVVEELPLDRSSLIYRKLMDEPACNDVALSAADPSVTAHSPAVVGVNFTTFPLKSISALLGSIQSSGSIARLS